MISLTEKDDILNLSQAMQKLIITLLDNPEALGHFIEQGGLELAVDKLTAKHHVSELNETNLNLWPSMLARDEHVQLSTSIKCTWERSIGRISHYGGAKLA